jgi:hypothetical protein
VGQRSEESLITSLWIDLPYACYGVRVENNYIVEAPPIARWMVGKTVQQVVRWVKSKGGKGKYITCPT